MSTTTAPTTQSLSDVVRWQAAAEAHTIQAMLDYRDAELARTKLIEPSLRRKIEQSAIALTIGEATGCPRPRSSCGCRSPTGSATKHHRHGMRLSTG